MSSFLKAVRFAREKPAGCTVASLISLAMMLGVVVAAFWLFFAFIGVRAFRETLASSTGFYPIYENAFVNVFTGEFTIDRLTLFNPPAYERISTDGHPEDAKPFAKIKNLKMRVSPFSLLSGSLKISDFCAEVEILNCYRINRSNYNLDEFAEGFVKIAEIMPDSSGEKIIKNFSLKIDRAEYKDTSVRKNVLIMRSTEPFYFSDSDVPDTKRLISKIEESLGKCGMSFVSSGLGAFEKNENIDSGKR